MIQSRVLSPMAHNNLPCDGDGDCMVCETKPQDDENITCNTCATPWHVTCLSVPPQTLADAARWECPDCSFVSNPDAPPISVAVPGRSDLIAAIGAIDVDQSLTEQEKAKRRQELLSGGTGDANHEEVTDGDNDVLDLFQESLNCSFCMQLLDRPVTVIFLTCLYILSSLNFDCSSSISLG